MRSLALGFCALALGACALDDDYVVREKSSRRMKRESRRDEVDAFVRPMVNALMHDVRTAFERRFDNVRICDQGRLRLKCTFYYAGTRNHDTVVLTFSSEGRLIDWALRN